jgi:hypothetical protein
LLWQVEDPLAKTLALSLMPLDELKQQAKEQLATSSRREGETVTSSPEEKPSKEGANSNAGTNLSTTGLEGSREHPESSSGEPTIDRPEIAAVRQSQEQQQQELNEEKQEPTYVKAVTALGEEDLVVKGLLQWFKHSFFKWVRDSHRRGNNQVVLGACGYVKSKHRHHFLVGSFWKGCVCQLQFCCSCQANLAYAFFIGD